MKKKIQYSETDMAALISEIEGQFSTRIAKAEKDKTDLKKSETESVAKVEETPVVEAAAPKEQGCDYDESDIAEMNAMYGSMTKAEAAIHFESLKKTLSIEDTIVKTEAPATEVVAKSEVKDEKSETKGENDETKLLKSEIETLKSEKEKLEKSFQDLTAKLVAFVRGNSAPKQKAITKLDFVAKSEDDTKKIEEKTEDVTKLEKSEVSRRLTAKIRSGKLEKAEREKINQYYETGSKNIESIRHLL